MLSKSSDALSGASAEVRAARDQADSLKTLHRPVVSIDAQVLDYQKTLNLDLGGLKNQAEGAASGALGAINATGVPGVPSDVVSAVTSKVQAALPSIFASIPDSVSLREQQTLFHPTVTAVLPIYTGGAIPAAQREAEAAVALAEATQASAKDMLQVQLVRAYFGQVLAAQVLAVARDTRDGAQRHLDDAQRLEQQGVLSHARRLEVEVARDAAQRNLDQAEGNYRTAVDALTDLVHGGGDISPTTGLFVGSASIGPVQPFLDAAEADHPQLRKAEAGVEAGRQGVKLAQSQELPAVYAFGEYNLDRRDELAVEPDWIFGVGVHYTLMSSIDRHKATSAAREREAAAEAAERQARVDLRTNITQAYDLVETARRQFLSLDSSIAAAREALRVQEVSFREGEATASEVIDARNALGQARTQRVAAAYEYDLALAVLLLASGETERFTDYLHGADRQVAAP